MPIFFAIGWAAVQVSHLSIANSLSQSQKTRDKLSNFRNSVTFAGNIVVLSVALLLFIFLDNKKDQFRYLCYFLIFIGMITSLFYILIIDEPYLNY